MMSTTALLVMGLGLHAWVNLAVVRRFGLLSSAVVILALLADLILLPALLRLLYRPR